mgnify:CR=1 FL=1
MSKTKLYLPVVLSLVLCFGILMGAKINRGTSSSGAGFGNTSAGKYSKLTEILSYIEHEYVDSVNRVDLEEKAIQTLLQELDPHSYYIPPQDLAAMNEPLEGNFEGIGVEFRIQKDTVTVITPTEGGPSSKLGIMPGDRIVKVNGELIAGIGINNREVMDLLRGKRGTTVKVSIKRKDRKDLLDFEIERDKIPIYSVDVAYMLTENAGYIKISRFAKTTYDEFMDAVSKLKAKGMEKLVIDLRGNGGGYMDAAVNIIDELMDKGQLIVYTEGKARPRRNYYSSKKGQLKDTQITVLIDESSASASEIVAGAIQDNDRGTVIGRRSFGKGLVQEPSEWPDGSALRLTIARYYTPTGRCIQKPYEEGVKKYYQEYYERIEKGELQNSDSINFPDSLKFTTPKGKIVYGGGGIMPDIFVPYDTTGRSYYFSDLIYSGIFRQFAFDYADTHREELVKYQSFSELNKLFQIDQQLYDEFIAYGEAKGVKKDAYGIKVSEELIKNRLKANIVNHIWNNDGFYPIIHEQDNIIKTALKVI